MREKKREKVWECKYTFGDELTDGKIRQIAQEMGISEKFAVSAAAAKNFMIYRCAYDIMCAVFFCPVV